MAVIVRFHNDTEGRFDDAVDFERKDDFFHLFDADRAEIAVIAANSILSLEARPPREAVLA